MRTRLLGALLLIGLVAGCGKPVSPPADGGDSGDDAQQRQGGVYAAVLRHHLESRDNGAGGDRAWTAVYVLDRAVKNAADPQRSITDDKGAPISRDVQREITKRLSGVAPVRFIHSRDDVVGGKQDCQLKRKGAILITLAPVPASGDQVKVGVNGWQGCLAGTWQTYVVVADGDGWKVTGTTGSNSIS